MSHPAKQVLTLAIALLILSLGMLVPGPAAAEGEAPTPNLLGTWIGVDGSLIFWHHGTTEFGDTHHVAIEVTEQEGPLLKATMTYRITQPGVQAHDGTELTNDTSEPLIGVVGLDGKSVSFADTADVGYHHAVLVDDDTLALTTLESGEFALAGRILLKRQQ